MELATKNAVVLLDGDLQDPPELIAQFVERWQEGYDVVYGRRVSRETTWFMQRAYRAFYWAFDRFSYLSIPRDAGDFSLMDRRVVQAMLQCDERDLFLRGVRAFVGFRQTGVDYVRPKRMFGVTTNNLRRNIGWAKKGIFSFSNVPLTMLSFAGTVLFVLSLVLAAAQGVARAARARQRAAGRRHGRHPRAAVRLAQPVRDRARRRIPGARLRGGQAPAAVRPLEHRARRRGAPRLALGRRALGIAAAMIAMRPRASVARVCPVCGGTGGRELAPARIDAAALGEYAFASRKFPEYMHHRLVECATCDARLRQPDARRSATSARPTTRPRSTARRRRCSRAAPTPGSCARSPAPAARRGALDIGTGRGLVPRGAARPRLHARARLRAVGGAARGGRRARVRALIVHDVFDAPGASGRRARTTSMTCCMTIEHVADPARALPRRARPARPGRRADARLPRPPRAAQPRRSARVSPIMDIEHLQVFSQASARAAAASGPASATCAMRRITNRYPLHYWLKLAPLPRRRQARRSSPGARRGPLPRCRSRCRSATSPSSASATRPALVEAHDGAAVARAMRRIRRKPAPRRRVAGRAVADDGSARAGELAPGVPCAEKTSKRASRPTAVPVEAQVEAPGPDVDAAGIRAGVDDAPDRARRVARSRRRSLRAAPARSVAATYCRPSRPG